MLLKGLCGLFIGHLLQPLFDLGRNLFIVLIAAVELLLNARVGLFTCVDYTLEELVQRPLHLVRLKYVNSMLVLEDIIEFQVRNLMSEVAAPSGPLARCCEHVFFYAKSRLGLLDVGSALIEIEAPSLSRLLLLSLIQSHDVDIGPRCLLSGRLEPSTLDDLRVDVARQLLHFLVIHFCVAI